MQDAIALVLGTTVLGIGLGFGFTLGAKLFDAQSDLNQRLIDFIICKIKKEK